MMSNKGVNIMNDYFTYNILRKDYSIEIPMIKRTFVVDGEKKESFVINKTALEVTHHDLLEHLTVCQYMDTDAYFEPESAEDFGVFLKIPYWDDIGDYGLDDEYDPFWVEKYHYIPLKHDPNTGKPFSFHCGVTINCQDFVDKQLKTKNNPYKFSLDSLYRSYLVDEKVFNELHLNPKITLEDWLEMVEKSGQLNYD